MDPGKPDLVGDSSAHGSMAEKLELDDFQGHFQPKPFYHSVIMAYLPYHHIPPAHIQDTFIQISLS